MVGELPQLLTTTLSVSAYCDEWATTVVVPFAFARSSPEASTSATVVFAEVHVRPVAVVPAPDVLARSAERRAVSPGAAESVLPFSPGIVPLAGTISRCLVSGGLTEGPVESPPPHAASA